MSLDLPRVNDQVLHDKSTLRSQSPYAFGYYPLKHTKAVLVFSPFSIDHLGSIFQTAS